MLQTAFRPSYMNQESVFEWHKRFKEGKVDWPKGTRVSCVYYQQKCPYEKKVWKPIVCTSYIQDPSLEK